MTTLGLNRGSTVMLHASYRAIGQVVGGPPVVVQALLDVLSPVGTLVMYVGWENCPYMLPDATPDLQALYVAEHPPYDPTIARAVRDHGVLAECVRTWPSALRSAHPDSSFCAIGSQAAWITSDHPFNYGYGRGSPLEKLCQLGGQVLMLGAPLDTVTLLHYAEHMAELPGKRVIQYRAPILNNGETVWVELEEFDTGNPVVDADYTFEGIVGDYLASGKGRVGTIGYAKSHLFDAADIASYGRTWLEGRFGSRSMADGTQ
jgi:aminoglycoside 3-N-acetyltransferase